MNKKEIEQEITELERKAQDPLNNAETLYLCELYAHLLRHGYQLQHAKDDNPTIAIIHLATGKVVYHTTENELRFARIGKAGWLKIAQEEYYKIAEGLRNG